MPLEWAMTQMNLGIALETLGGRESGTTRLEEAVTACRKVLQVRTRARVPLQWADTQNNLGTALAVLGGRESGTARLDEAVVAFREALTENTRERVPREWAKSTGNQGIALVLLAEKLHDVEKAKLAVEQIEAVISTLHDGDVHSATKLQTALLEARAIRDKLTAP
jgi:hypothetical protein